MKVLLISHTVLSKTGNMGKTLRGYLMDYTPDEVAQFYIHSEIPTDNSVCQNYFRFTVVAAFSHLEVGIDIEQKRKARMEVARRFFHPAEIQCLQNLAGDAQDELFFRYWSVKESFLKYTGSGLSSPLSGFEVRFDDHRPRIFQSENLRNLSISACPVDPAYKCFVCAETTEEPVIFPFLVPDLFLPDE